MSGPISPVAKPLSVCRVALLSTAGISMRDDEPFDMEFERKRPTRGDSSWRHLRSDATSAKIHANHLHIDLRLMTFWNSRVATATSRR